SLRYRSRLLASTSYPHTLRDSLTTVWAGVPVLQFEQVSFDRFRHFDPCPWPCDQCPDPIIPTNRRNSIRASASVTSISVISTKIRLESNTSRTASHFTFI